jgi:hypothetical protein
MDIPPGRSRSLDSGVGASSSAVETALGIGYRSAISAKKDSIASIALLFAMM